MPSPYMDPHVESCFSEDNSRSDVLIPTFDKLIRAGLTTPGVRNERILSNFRVDSYTGKPRITWGEDEDIDVLMNIGRSTLQNIPLGAIGASEQPIATADPLAFGDRLVINSVKYEVTSEPQEVWSERTGFCHRIVVIKRRLV